MAVLTPNLISVVLVNALNSTDATVTFTIDKKFADNTGAYYNLTDDIATGVIQNLEVTWYNTSTKAAEMMRLNGITSTTTTSDGRPIYVGTIELNGATKLRGLANTYDGTTSTANVITNKIITTFPKNSPGVIAVNSGQIQRALTLFATGTTTDTAVAGENLTALNSVSLHSDGKVYKYHASNYPNLCGIVTGTVSSGATATFTRNEGTSAGHSSLTPGVTYYAENTGAITSTPSATTRLLGQAKNATTIYVGIQGPKDSAFIDSAFYVADDADGTKKALFSLGGATTGKTVTFVSSHTDNRTITFPDASGALLNSGSANVLDSGFRIQDDGDNTKQIAFQASGITTGTTRTITMPNTNVDLGAVLLPATASYKNRYTFSAGPGGTTGPTTTTVTWAHGLGRTPTCVLISGKYEIINDGGADTWGIIFPVSGGYGTVTTGDSASLVSPTLNTSYPHGFVIAHVINGGSYSKYIVNNFTVDSTNISFDAVFQRVTNVTNTANGSLEVFTF